MYISIMTFYFSSRGYKKEEDDEQHARELEIRQEELASEERRTKAQEETKRMKTETTERNKHKMAEECTKHVMVQAEQRRMELEAVERTKIAQERTKIAQERTKIAQERTKQRSRVATIVTKLAKNEIDTTTVIEFLGKMSPITTSCTIPEEPVEGELAIAKQE